MSCAHANLRPLTVVRDAYGFQCADCGEVGEVSGVEVFALMKNRQAVPDLETLVRSSMPRVVTVEDES